jgi:hypothetical protein
MEKLRRMAPTLALLLTTFNIEEPNVETPPRYGSQNVAHVVKKLTIVESLDLAERRSSTIGRHFEIGQAHEGNLSVVPLR